MPIQLAFSLPIWVLFIEIALYASIILFLFVPRINRNIRVKRVVKELIREQNERINRSITKAESLRSEIEFRSLDANEKRRRTMLQRYGVEYAFRWTPNEKRRRTMLQRYGVEYAFNLSKQNES